ncbi:VOC family protein [Dyella japonica]|uniref:Glyoxalase n=1 Tax=Dyella japonica A8 TaxID=1217721 RepID=A0A075K128_9GAMM|nr:VOC family protein [Dyella japonica]AIF47525.1 glyoxalase [Dyella japonica A8]
MIDHVGLQVSGYERSREFYRKALAPLGAELVMEVTEEQTGDGAHAGFGVDGRPTFWIGTSQQAHANGIVHVAFTAASRAAVMAFHRAALEAGGKDNGAPGLRPHYHAHYYGAFVLDPDGHNIEAVCHAPA